MVQNDPLGLLTTAPPQFGMTKANWPGFCWYFETSPNSTKKEQHLQDALTYADGFIATMREPFVVLDKDLRIKTANRAFYQTFATKKEETENQLIYDLGNGQWNIARLLAMLNAVLSDQAPVHDFEIEHDFPAIGKKVMLLNARRFQSVDSQPDMLLLAIEDISERKQAEVAVQTSKFVIGGCLKRRRTASLSLMPKP